MLVAAAVCPCLPSLALAADVGAAAAPERLRAACAEAVAAVLAEEPEIVAVVGPGGRSLLHEEGTLWAPRDLGLPLGVRLGRGRAAKTPASGLPMALGVGARLLEQAGWSGPVRAYELDDARSWATNGEDGVHLAGWADRVGLLVAGNGPTHADADGARRLDPRAEEIDAGVAAALASGDADGFFPDMDAGLARELGVSGRSPWQLLDGADWDLTTHRLLYAGTVDGVSCFVATWSP
ncbi:hypothetical protein [Kitasatospora phosalacinea]|uniref:hypothetical protein n=1 Tax=Kitasatospora phosalacinea TaxID=2065 RepID=UPI000524E885|nr:hypothetical protein [Kitasatospora phosalacinea]